jgi:hypothetical protein
MIGMVCDLSLGGADFTALAISWESKQWRMEDCESYSQIHK